MTSYRISMAEELISFWTSWLPEESLTDCGWYPYIHTMVLLTNWSYLGHYPADLSLLKLPESSTQSMETDQTDMHTLCTSARGTTVDVSHSKDSTSRDEVDPAEHGGASPSSTSSTCSNICCVTPGSCVYLKSAAPPSTSHLVQVSFVLYTVLVGCL